MKKLRLFGEVAIVVLLTSCGHNVVSYGDMVGVTTGFDGSGNMTVGIRYGKTLVTATREHSKVTYKGDTEVSAESGVTTTQGAEITVEVGDQINGYTVDLASAENKQTQVTEEVKTEATEATETKEEAKAEEAEAKEEAEAETDQNPAKDLTTSE